MEEKYLTTAAEAALFGVATSAIAVRPKNMSSYPQRVPHPIFGTQCRKLSDLQAYGRAYHEHVWGKSLFSKKRLSELSPEEIEVWGCARQVANGVGR